MAEQLTDPNGGRLIDWAAEHLIDPNGGRLIDLEKVVDLLNSSPDFCLPDQMAVSAVYGRDSGNGFCDPFDAYSHAPQRENVDVEGNATGRFRCRVAKDARSFLTIHAAAAAAGYRFALFLYRWSTKIEI
ncbi:hypothetical protein BV898_07294 [Hypsibius exemplaris]|uniref:Uncharacterized protein n=1 Tax=Hypsibius exemplaris TaxID=2072580 RepID=A0A1W0WTZ0_HYPEX|nr:hypothetical protein BV898_07294 [Hypsibius exemplaris]